MRIVINARSILKKQTTGIGRYAYHLIEKLGQIDQENDYILYAPKSLFDMKRRLPRFAQKNLSVKSDFFARGLDNIVKDFDLYHAPSPEFISTQNPHVVVTVHDIIFKTYPHVHTSETKDILEQQMAAIVQRASRIICISERTKQDLLEHYDVAEDRLAVVYHGVDQNQFYQISKAEELQAKQYLKTIGVENKFILFVGTIEPRKNLSNLLTALKKLKEQKRFNGTLLVSGMKGWMNEREEGLLREMAQLKEHVVRLGYVSNAQLRALYNMAEVFVFPSFYEGFGFPVVEAFACGTPVITSDGTSCAEIAGDAAISIDPHSPEQIADAIHRVLTDEEKKKTLIAKGLDRAKIFSFENMARKTLDVYREVHESAQAR